MAAKDYFHAILEGGLPNLLDYGSSAGNAQGDTRSERRAPDPTNRDNMGLSLQTITQTQILTVTAAILAVLGVIYLVRN